MQNTTNLNFSRKLKISIENATQDLVTSIQLAIYSFLYLNIQMYIKLIIKPCFYVQEI